MQPHLTAVDTDGERQCAGVGKPSTEFARRREAERVRLSAHHELVFGAVDEEAVARSVAAILPPASECATPWIRARFKADDARPIKWPPPAPSWCTGSVGDREIVVAYVRTIEQVTEYWPDATDITHTIEAEIMFTDRFPRPTWWTCPARKDTSS